MSDTIRTGTAVGPVPASARPYAAELLGTMVLVLIGPGSAIIASDVIGNVGVALAFGLALTAMAFTIGSVSGCHINPAITLGFLIAKRIEPVTAGVHMACQVVGAIVGGLILYVITENGDLDTTGVFAANGWGDAIGVPFGLGSVMVVEIVFTALLVFVVLSTVSKGYPAGFGGIVVGATLTMIHLATIPVDNTSVNPARSIGTAVFAGTDALEQLWAFIVFPLIGSVVGYGAWLLVHEPNDE